MGKATIRSGASGGGLPMPDFLRMLDVGIFMFINGTLANPLTDAVMPFLTDLNLTWPGRALYAAALILLIVRGGKQGRAAVLLLIPVIAVADQMSSNIIKDIFMRPRPCHLVDGATVVGGVRLLVGCGGGFSFPSSHAVNHFAAATFLSDYYPKARAYLFGYASLVGLSRIFVGVHYPSDVLGGALIGTLVGLFFVRAWAALRAQAPLLRPYGPAAATTPPPGS
jgi:undecaprenyl-diphosphatase